MTLPPAITLVRLRVDPATREAALPVLSPEERARMESFRHDERRGAFAVGRLAARTLVAERLGCAAREVALDVREDGSVRVAGDVVHVSISHSGSEVAAVVSDGHVAVDLERIKPRPISLYRFMLHPDELSLLDVVPGPDDRRIALLWSVKESVLKGRRTGLRHSPKSLRIAHFDPAGTARVRADDGESWQVAFDVGGKCALAVAWPA